MKNRKCRYRLPADLVARMHAEYSSGKSLAEVCRLFGKRNRKTVRDVFKCRGLKVRPVPYQIVRGKSGRIAPIRRRTATEIRAIISQLAKLGIPAQLRVEWRKWPLARRHDFISRV